MPEVNLDLDFVRSHFPQLENGWAFFENAGGSYMPLSVLERINRYMRELQIQPGGPWPQSQRAADMIAEGHRAMAALVNARAEEVVIGPSTTLNVYVLAQAMASSFQAGDEIIVTNQDHEANIGAWRGLADKGLVLKEWCVNPETAQLEISGLQALLTEKTKLLCFPHVSNILGSINDVAKITQIAHQAGVKVCVDGVAYAAHRSVDVKAWDVDYYLLSLYKVYGPHLALLYGKKDLLVQADNQNHYFFADNALPAKLNPGGQQHELAASLAGIVEYFEALYSHHIQNDQTCSLKDRIGQVFDLISRQELALGRRLLNYLSQQKKIRLIGSEDSNMSKRVPTISFLLEGYDPAVVTEKLSEAKVATRHGHFYAHRLVSSLGLLEHNGVIRCSMLHYNTLEELERMIVALDRLIN